MKIQYNRIRDSFFLKKHCSTPAILKQSFPLGQSLMRPTNSSGDYAESGSDYAESGSDYAESGSDYADTGSDYAAYVPAPDMCAKYTKCSSPEDCQEIGRDVCVVKIGCGRICNWGRTPTMIKATWSSKKIGWFRIIWNKLEHPWFSKNIHISTTYQISFFSRH